MRGVFILATAAVLGAWLSIPAAGQNQFTTLYTFSNGRPLGLTYANGVFYGATYENGSGRNCGTVFELQPPASTGGAWTETMLYAFSNLNQDACGPLATPVVGHNGAIYGFAGGGAYNWLSVYEVQPPASAGGPWTESVIYSIPSLNGPPDFTAPGSLILGPNGSLYLAMLDGGIGYGAVVQLHPPAVSGGAWTETVVYNFPGTPGGDGPNSLIAGPHGVLYGTTQYGGMTKGSGQGTVFELLPPATKGGTWTGSVLYSFQGTLADGDVPYFVTPGPGGVLYGLEHNLGESPDSVFQLTPPGASGGAWTKTVIQSVGTLGYTCGADSPLIVRNGNIYGESCVTGSGVVYELQPPSTAGGPWTNITLYTFATGEIPGGAFVLTSNLTVFGATINGLTSGELYELTTTGPQASTGGVE